MKTLTHAFVAVAAACIVCNVRCGPAAADTLSPADLPGCVLWLDAADASTVSHAGTAVEAWRDKSGHGRSVRQTNPAHRPVYGVRKQNGRPLISFDGTTSYLTGPPVLPAGQSAYSYYGVWRPRRNSGVQSIFEQAASPLRRNTRAALLAVGESYGFNGESNDRHDLVPFSPDTWRLTCLDVDNAETQNIRIHDNGVTYEAASGDPKALALGADGITVGRKLAVDNEYFDGDIAEIIVYARILPRADRERVLWYLDRKWDLGCLGWFLSPDGQPLSFDFDSDSFAGWMVAGQAFGSGPAHGALAHQMPVTGFLGTGLANSYHGGDGATGTLTSPPFVITRKFISFLIGGGKYPGQTCIELVIDGTPVRTTTGPNDRPGGSEHLDWQQWDVTQFIGETATIRIVDQATGGWGHITVDQIIATDVKLPVLVDQSRDFVVEKRYLNLPVKNGAPKRHVKVMVDGAVVREFDIELAGAKPDFWVFLDLTPFKGKVLKAIAERVPEDSHALDAIQQSDRIVTGTPIYSEALRPQFHFTTRRGWNNDPNGLVWYHGEYHLFYQHNPYGIRWGNMQWGHAVSTDLVHWHELPVAIYPDKLGPVFSGSAVVDWNNTAGFGKGDEKTLICIYTAAGSPVTQCIAYSNDRGRTFHKYAGNPVLPHIIGGNRDPKVIWYAPGKNWIMALFLDKNTYGLFASPDLKHWHHLSDVTLPGTSECPEFFAIPLDGDKRNLRWIFYGGNGRYLVGRFDGTTFIIESGPQQFNYGNCFYASQTFNDIPAADGRRIQIAWGTVTIPGMPFNQMMDFPVELSLHTTADGTRLYAMPVREIARLYGAVHTWRNQPLNEGSNLLSGLRGDLFDIDAEFAVGDARQLGFVIRGIPVTYDVASQTLSCRDRSAPLPVIDGRLRLRLLVDLTSIEIFGNDGALYMPMGVILADADKSLGVFAKGGAATVIALTVHEMRSAWAADESVMKSASR